MQGLVEAGLEGRVALLEGYRQAQGRADLGAFLDRQPAVADGIGDQQAIADGGVELFVGHVLEGLLRVGVAVQVDAFDATGLVDELTALRHAQGLAVEGQQRAQWTLFLLAHDQLCAGIAVRFAEIETILEFRGQCYVIDGDVVLATLDAWQQVGGVGHHEVGAYIQFTGQQLAKLDFKAGKPAVILEVERRAVGFQRNAQFATVVYIVNQFSMSQWAHKGQQQYQARQKAHGHSLNSLCAARCCGALCYGVEVLRQRIATKLSHS